MKKTEIGLIMTIILVSGVSSLFPANEEGRVVRRVLYIEEVVGGENVGRDIVILNNWLKEKPNRRVEIFTSKRVKRNGKVTKIFLIYHCSGVNTYQSFLSVDINDKRLVENSEQIVCSCWMYKDSPRKVIILWEEKGRRKNP